MSRRVAVASLVVLALVLATTVACGDASSGSDDASTDGGGPGSATPDAHDARGSEDTAGDVADTMRDPPVTDGAPDLADGADDDAADATPAAPACLQCQGVKWVYNAGTNTMFRCPYCKD